MNHLTAWAITIIAFSSGIYAIYKYIFTKYCFTYDIKPIHYLLNKKTKIKKRYKTLKKRNIKHLRVNKINRIGSFTRYNSINK